MNAVWLLIGQRALPSIDATQGASGMTALHVAAKGGDVAFIPLLLKAGASPFARCAEGLTALDHAVQTHQYASITVLVRHLVARDPLAALRLADSVVADERMFGAVFAGIAAHSRVDAFLLAIRHGYIRGVEAALHTGISVASKALLVAARDAAGRSPLHIAIASGHAKIVAALLASGSDWGDRDAATAHLAIASGSVPVARELFAHMKGCNVEAVEPDGLLFAAIASGNAGMVELLLQCKAKVTSVEAGSGNSLLHTAAGGGWAPICTLLLKHGALTPDAMNARGETPLCSAILSPNCAAVTQVLLAHGAHVNPATPTTVPPLLFAVRQRNVTATQALLNASADPLVTDAASGETALHIACRMPHLGLIQELVKQRNLPPGAVLTAVDALGRTPLYSTIQAGHNMLARVLLKCHEVLGVPLPSTQLHVAARLNHPSVATFLLAPHVSAVLAPHATVTTVDAVDGDGDTALHIAASAGHDCVASILLAAGASVNAVGGHGLTPLAVSEAAQCASTSHLLRFHGGALTALPLSHGASTGPHTLNDEVGIFGSEEVFSRGSNSSSDSAGGGVVSWRSGCASASTASAFPGIRSVQLSHPFLQGGGAAATKATANSVPGASVTESSGTGDYDIGELVGSGGAGGDPDETDDDSLCGYDAFAASSGEAEAVDAVHVVGAAHNTPTGPAPLLAGSAASDDTKATGAPTDTTAEPLAEAFTDTHAGEDTHVSATDSLAAGDADMSRVRALAATFSTGDVDMNTDAPIGVSARESNQENGGEDHLIGEIAMQEDLDVPIPSDDLPSHQLVADARDADGKIATVSSEAGTRTSVGVATNVEGTTSVEGRSSIEDATTVEAASANGGTAGVEGTTDIEAVTSVEGTKSVDVAPTIESIRSNPHPAPTADTNAEYTALDLASDAEMPVLPLGADAAAEGVSPVTIQECADVTTELVARIVGSTLDAEGCLALLRLGASAAAAVHGSGEASVLHVAEESVLHVVARRGDVPMATHLLDHNAPVDLADSQGRTPLYIAAAAGRGEMCELLLARGANVDAISDDLRRLNQLHLAVVNDDSAVSHFLLQHNASVSAVSTSGESALHLAVQHGREAVVLALLQRGACVRLQARGCTPLHIAAKSGNAHVCSTLRTAGGAPLETADPTGSTALLLAAEGGHDAAVATLLSLGANPSASASSGKTPLHAASASGSQVSCSALLGSGADVSAVDGAGEQPIHAAARGCHAAIVRLLLQAGATVNVRAVDGCTPLHRCADTDSEDVGAGAPSASAAAVAELSELLLSADASIVDAVDVEGCTALHSAARHGRVGVVECLLAHGADPSVVCDHGNTPLHLAAEGGHAPICEALIDAFRKRSGGEEEDGRTCGYMDATDGSGETALMRAIKAGHVDVVATLLDNGCDVEGAAAATNQQCNTSGLSHRSSTSRSGKNSSRNDRGAGAGAGSEASSVATEEAVDVDDEDDDDIVMDTGADTSVMNHAGTPLCVAAATGSAAMCELLLDAGADVNAESGPDAFSALHAAARYGHFAAAGMLLRRGALLEGVESASQTPLQLAAAHGHLGVCEALGEAPVDTADSCGETALHEACRGGYADVVMHLLVEREADVNATSFNGTAPLHLVASNVHDRRDICAALLEQGASVDALDNQQQTPLRLAVKRGHERVSACLLAAGATVQAPLLHLAARMGHTAVCLLLLQAGATADEVDACGLTAVQLAEEAGYADTAAVLRDPQRSPPPQPEGAACGLLHGAANIEDSLEEEGEGEVATGEATVSALACDGMLDLQTTHAPRDAIGNDALAGSSSSSSCSSGSTGANVTVTAAFPIGSPASVATSTATSTGASTASAGSLGAETSPCLDHAAALAASDGMWSRRAWAVALFARNWMV